MPSKPKEVANIEIEKRARRMMALFPGSEKLHTIMTPKRQSPEWKPGDKVAAGYRIISTAPPVGAWVDHIEGKRGLVIALRKEDNTCRVGALDFDDYADKELGTRLMAAVKRQKLPIFLHKTKSDGWRGLVFYDDDVALADNTAILRGLARALGYEGKPEYFPPVQNFDGDDPPKPLQLNMPFFGDKYEVIRADSGLPVSLTGFLHEAERARMGAEMRAAMIKLGAKEARRTRKSDKRRATTELKRGTAYAEHRLDVYCTALANCPAGERNKLLTKHAFHVGQMVAREWITAAKVEESMEGAVAGWGGDIAKTADTLRRQVAAGQREPHDDLANIVAMTEDFAAMEFVSVHIDSLRYDWDKGHYYVWDDGTKSWSGDRTSPVIEMIRNFVREQTADEPPKVQARIVTKSFISAVEWHVRHTHALRATQDIWDTDPLLLGAPGCTIDLRTGEARESRREDYISRIAAVAPADAEDCPAWLQFLHQITRGDMEYQSFLQLCSGYSLIGDNRAGKLFFGVGFGGNGKGIYLDTTGKVLASMHFVAPLGMFASSQFSKPTNNLVSARFARILTSDENASDKFWDEEEIKHLTGGGKATGRGLYENNSTFTIMWTPWLNGNAQPRLKNVDGGIRRRLLMLPFDMRTTENPAEVDEAAWIFLKDADLPQRLQEELPGILRWLINGTLLYHKHQFHNVPAVVREATDEFFYAEDHLGRFMDTHFERTKSDADRVDARRVYSMYAEAMEREHQFVETQRQFTKKLGQRGYTFGPLGGYNAFKRLRPRKVAERKEELPI
jgi:putative DNA primase/helicase